MFGTLRYDKQSSNPDFIERSNGAQFAQMGSRGLQHSACNVCRSKKLKCNGRKSGCDRCKATKSTCEYSTNGDGRGARRQKRAGGRENNKRAPPENLVPATSPKPQSTVDKPTEAVSPTRENSTQVSNREDANMCNLPSPLSTTQAFDEDTDAMFSDQIFFDLLPDAGPEELDGFSAATGFQFHMEAENLPDFEFNSLLNENDIALLESNPCDMASLAEANPQPFFLPSPPEPPNSPLQLNSPPTQQPVHQTIVEEFSPLGRRHSKYPSQVPYEEKISLSPSHAQGRCQCLQVMVSRLEELENRKNTIDSNALDSVLVTHKEALSNCSTMLQCTHCSPRSENMMLLALVCEKLVALSEKLVNKYLQQAKPAQSPGASRKQSINIGACDELARNIQSAQICYGAYNVDAGLGFQYVTRILILLELRSLKSFMADMKSTASSAIRGAQLAVLQAAQRRLSNIIMVLTQCDVQSGMV
ncbi:hypothetical protein MMC22_009526 [Lobaria immixta]|nr:hypothetical protein [Lobaria immixta]